ncbi:maleylpyruvate isomerase family mycothiol-dependent enzyme [Nocardioides caeni]
MVAGLDVLQRALDYTCAGLRSVTADDLTSPTPCSAWNLADLLAHMEDALDAFAEAAGGAIALRSTAPAPLPQRIAALQRKAAGLLSIWLAAADGAVAVEGSDVPIDAVARLAALEIAVHGWDVHRALGGSGALPETLALALLPIAALTAAAPTGSFARPLPCAAGAPPGVRLLGLLGRTADA